MRPSYVWLALQGWYSHGYWHLLSTLPPLASEHLDLQQLQHFFQAMVEVAMPKEALLKVALQVKAPVEVAMPKEALLKVALQVKAPVLDRQWLSVLVSGSPNWYCSGPVVGDIALACPWTPASSSASSEQRVLVCCSMMPNPNHEWRSGYDATQLVSHHPGQAAGKKVPPHRIQTCGIHLLPMIMIKCTPNEKNIYIYENILIPSSRIAFCCVNAHLHWYTESFSRYIYIYLFVHYKKQW